MFYFPRNEFTSFSICSPNFCNMYNKIKQLCRSFPWALKPNNRLSDAGGEGSTSIINSRRPERHSVRCLPQPTDRDNFHSLLLLLSGLLFFQGRFSVDYARVDPCNPPLPPSVFFNTLWQWNTPSPPKTPCRCSQQWTSFLYTAALEHAEQFLERDQF